MAPKTTGSRWASSEAQVGKTVTRRIIGRSFGPQKAGKTRFWLTAPAPIFMLSFDIGLEGVVEPFIAAGKDIRALEYAFNAQDYRSETETAKAANELWKQFTDDYVNALKEARTVIVDTETEAWELLRYARFGAQNDAPRNYPALNAEYRDLIRKAYGAGVNVGLIQKVKEKWVSKMDPSKGKLVAHNTGEMEPAGMKEVGFLVQCNLRHERVLDQNNNIVYQVVLEDARHNDAQPFVGQTHENLDFPTLGQMCFPDTTEEDWK